MKMAGSSDAQGEAMSFLPILVTSPKATEKEITNEISKRLCAVVSLLAVANQDGHDGIQDRQLRPLTSAAEYLLEDVELMMHVKHVQCAT